MGAGVDCTAHAVTEWDVSFEDIGEGLSLCSCSFYDKVLFSCITPNHHTLLLFSSSFHVVEGMSTKTGGSTSTISAMVLVHWPVEFHTPAVFAR